MSLSLVNYSFLSHRNYYFLHPPRNIYILGSVLSKCLKIDVRIYPGLQKEKKNISSELHRPSKKKKKQTLNIKRDKKGFFLFLGKKKFKNNE
jgi:hypothetical protein